MVEGKEFYKKYRWFFTSSGKLVYGGKSAEQNDEVVNELLKQRGKDYILMHTRIPGSPFAVIRYPVKDISEEDLDEVAVWTGCFSRAWRQGMKNVEVDIFKLSDVSKPRTAKSGTFAVKNKIKRKKVKLKLALINQKSVLRAVSEASVKKTNKVFGKIIPGSLTKEKFAKQISGEFGKSKEEVLNALPTGGFKEITK